MAGSMSPTIWRDIGLARGQSTKLLQAEAASKVVNLVANPLGGLSTPDGFCPMEPVRNNQAPISGTPYGVFQARLNSVYTMTLCRFGSTLYEHRGWTRSFYPLATGLTDSVNAEWPDQFVQVGETIVWNNGVDRARQISMNGMVSVLGFFDTPSAPAVDGPECPSEGDKMLFYNNSLGLSWPGNVGTSSNAMYGVHGKLLAGHWRYALQFEDCFGNLSKISYVSATIKLGEFVVKPHVFEDSGSVNLGADGIDVHDMMKMFCVHTEDSSSIDTLWRVHILRTKNTKYEGNDFYRVASFSVTSGVSFGDRTSDGGLGARIEPHEAVPIFRHMTSSGDRLIIANTTLYPNLVMVSDYGFPGTFRTKNKAMFPSEVTGVKAHGGKVFVFTQEALFEMHPDTLAITPVSAGVGCVAHRSICSMPDGSMMWLGKEFFYRMDYGGNISPLGDEIKSTLKTGLNRVRRKKAVSWVDPLTSAYMIALSRAGVQSNALILSYHPMMGWSEFNYGLTVDDAYVGVNEHVLVAGTTGAEQNVFVLNREVAGYTPPTRTSTYRTHWIKIDSYMRESFSLRNLFLTFVETGNYSMTIKVYRNQIYVPVNSQTFNLYDLPINTGDVSTWFNSATILGTNKLREARIGTRWLSFNDIGLDGSTDVHSCMIEIECVYPSRMHILGLAYSEQPPMSVKEIEGRLPHAEIT